MTSFEAVAIASAEDSLGAPASAAYCASETCVSKRMAWCCVDFVPARASRAI